MADISQITLLNGTTYNLKDQQARDDIAAISGAIAGGVTFMGETTTVLTDGSTAASIVINGATITSVKGYLVVYDSKEFIYDGAKWIELGDLSLIGDLGWKDSASATYTPAGSVSQPTFTGTEMNATGSFTPEGTVSQPTFTGSSMTATGTFTPEGSVSAPTISVKTAGATTTVNSITAVGTLPTLTTTVTNENLTIGFDQGTLPTKGANTTVKTGDAAYQASVPTFTGDAGSVSVSGTPSGTVSQPTFTGDSGSVFVSGTPSGTVSKPTFSGTQATITVT